MPPTGAPLRTGHADQSRLWWTPSTTNFAVAYQTNWHTRTLTNQVAVNVLRTNIVDQYRTNLSTLSLTNWETVVLFQTNWITQPITNVVRITMPTPSAATVAATQSNPRAKGCPGGSRVARARNGLDRPLGHRGRQDRPARSQQPGRGGVESQMDREHRRPVACAELAN